MSRAAKEALAQALEYARSGEACDHDAAHVRHFCRMAAEHIERAQYLIPDTGLEERIREWAKRKPKGLHVQHRGGYKHAQTNLLNFLDTPEAEPEPPPDAGVTREELDEALQAVAWYVEKGDGVPLARFCARLRREEER
jgi:hypothetical protein